MKHAKIASTIIASLALVLFTVGCGKSSQSTSTTQSTHPSQRSSAQTEQREVTFHTGSYKVGQHLDSETNINNGDGAVSLIPGVYDVTAPAGVGSITVARGNGSTPIFSQSISSDTSRSLSAPLVRLSLRKFDVVHVDDDDNLTFTPVKNRIETETALESGKSADIAPGLYDFDDDLPKAKLTMSAIVDNSQEYGGYPPISGPAYQLFGIDAQGDVSDDAAVYGFTKDAQQTLNSMPQSGQFLALSGAVKFHIVAIL